MIDLGRPIPPGTRILVAMSGGVDSSMTAILLQRAGYECVGINMRTHELEVAGAAKRSFQSCCSPEDSHDARTIANIGNFPFYVLDLKQEFEKAVINPFIQDYLSGRTPNPCVLCNNYLKLGVLLEKARAWGCDYVATGHYVRVRENQLTGRMELHRAVDREKDQSYYLFGLRQEQLRRLVCPLGTMTKAQVRQLAEEFGLPVHDKPDSQEICFVPDGDYRNFLKKRLGDEISRPGKIVLRDGTIVGEHTGIANYTIGQRRGLGIAYREPLYVIDIDPTKNEVIVGTAQQTFQKALLCRGLNWVSMAPPADCFEALAQIRYRTRPSPAHICPREDGTCQVIFHTPQRAITPGQAVVFYEGDMVLGGGWIEKVLPAETSCCEKDPKATVST